MAEEFEKQQQYKYSNQANLVINRKDNIIHEKGPSGESTTLSAYKFPQLRAHMGHRAGHEKPVERTQRLANRKRRLQGEEEASRKRRRTIAANNGGNVLDAEVDTAYTPTNSQSAVAYEGLMKWVEQRFGAQPRDLSRSVADELLRVAKNRNQTPEQKRTTINTLFKSFLPASGIDELGLNDLLKISNNITDWANRDVNVDEKAARVGDQGVAVTFGEEEDEDVTEVKELGDDGEDSGDDVVPLEYDDPERLQREQLRREQSNKQLASHMQLDENDEMSLATQKAEIDPKDVDAHWLQREIKNNYPALNAYDVSEKLLKVLEQSDRQRVETFVVQELGVSNWEFCKKLVTYKDVIVWCTKLRRAGNDAEREQISSTMSSDPNLVSILEELQTTHGTAAARTKQFVHKIYREATQLKRQMTEHKSGDGATDMSEAAQWNKAHTKQVVDLESLAFRQAGRLMTNSEWKLHKGCQPMVHKTYHEIIVPARTVNRTVQQLIRIDELPKWAQRAFGARQSEDSETPAIERLNEIQSKCYDRAFNSSENILLCAPTGAGKTNVALLTILREIGAHMNKDGTIRKDEFKCVYVAPMKSLVREITRKFQSRLACYGLEVRELSGDHVVSKEQMAHVQIIVATPEKWDVITRKGMDRSYAQLVRLVIIDEIHLLHDTRGAVLECIVARTQRTIETSGELIRIVGLSATLPNFDDVAVFLRVNEETGLFVFDQTHRPVPLSQRFAGVTVKKPYKQAQVMNELCHQYVREQVMNKQQVIVFVHSRKETANVARMLRDQFRDSGELGVVLPTDSGDYELVREEAENVSDDNLKDLLPNGFAIHHAGMSRHDRGLIEDLFAANSIKVLCSTATLAWGVNLPAHAVIIKGTQVYNPEKGRWMELSMLDVMQMFGRAGRPQYDKLGEAYMITTHAEFQYYMPLLNEQLPIESQLVARLPDSLNAEIVLGSVQNLKEAVDWLVYTYLYVRMLRDPELYSVPVSSLDSDEAMLQRRIDLAHSSAVALAQSGLINYDVRTGHFQSLDLGRVAAHYYISHETMRVYAQNLESTTNDIDLLRVFSLSGEFRYINVREGEKEELAGLLDKVPIPVKETMEESTAKVNVLLQAYVSRLQLDGFQLVSDMVYVTQSAGRLMRALFEIVLKKGWSNVAIRCLTFCKMINHKMWSIESPLRQFKGMIPSSNGQNRRKLPQSVVSRIEKSQIGWEMLVRTTQDEIAELIRARDYCQIVYDMIHHVPKLVLQGNVQPLTRTMLKVELVINADFMWNEATHGNSQEFWIFVENVDQDCILHHEYFLLKRKVAQEEHRLVFTIPIVEPLPPQYYIRAVSDKWIGSETSLPISFRHLVLPNKHHPPTELLDLQPLPVSVMEVPNAQEILGVEYLNAIQTQVYSELIKDDTSFLLAAPTRSGKRVCAEIAMIKMFYDNPQGKCLIIEPKEELAMFRFRTWQEKYGDRLQKSVVKMTGDVTQDLKLLKAGDIVIATPPQMDSISRRWDGPHRAGRRRRKCPNINLLILDELHLVCENDVGATYEMVVSRMRNLIDEEGMKCRIVGLSVSVANAKDLGDWIDAPSKSIFHFSPSVRPIRQDLHIQSSDINSFESRMMAFIKPCYLYITRFCPNDRVIIFAPSRKHCRGIASDLIALAASDGRENRFVGMDNADDLKPYLDQIERPALRKCCQYGVGFLHPHITGNDRQKVLLFSSVGAIRVLVVEHSLAWSLNDERLKYSMCIFMDTQFYDGVSHSYVDYSLCNMVQMMGKACEASQSNSSPARVVVLCHSSKKEYFRKFLRDPFPIESSLSQYLEDHINSEIARGQIGNANDAIDVLTWSFYWRRLTQNPNYYNLKGVSHEHLSTHLSELVEECFTHLYNAHCIQVDEEMDVLALNNGYIACHYGVAYTTVEIFSQSIVANSAMRDVLSILSYATEFEQIGVRNNEDVALSKMAKHLKIPIPNADYTSVPSKVNVLLQTHFSRHTVKAEVAMDRDVVIGECIKLLHSMVDVLATAQHLTPALIAIELCQMVTQACWDGDSPLLQLPHVRPREISVWNQHGVTNVMDLFEVEEDEQNAVFQLYDEKKVAEICAVANMYPSLEIDFDLEARWNAPDDISARGFNYVIDPDTDVVVSCVVEKQDDEDEDEDGDVDMDSKEEDDDSAKLEAKMKKQCPVALVHAPRYPQSKREGWFLVIGDLKTNRLLSVKRFQMTTEAKRHSLKFVSPSRAGEYHYVMYLMSDSYLSCDKEMTIDFVVPRDAEVASTSDQDGDVEME